MQTDSASAANSFGRRMRSPDDRAHSVYPAFLLPMNCRIKPHIVDTARLQWMVIWRPEIRRFNCVVLEARTGRYQAIRNWEITTKFYKWGLWKQDPHSVTLNHTNKDVIPPLSLEYDCCGSIDNTFKLDELHFHIPPKKCYQFTRWFKDCQSQGRGRREFNTRARMEN